MLWSLVEPYHRRSAQLWRRLVEPLAKSGESRDPVIIVTTGAFVAQQAMKERGQDARTVSIPTKRALLTRDLQREEASRRAENRVWRRAQSFPIKNQHLSQQACRATTYVPNIASQLKCGSMEGTLCG
jgi:hypothetical protein